MITFDEKKYPQITDAEIKDALQFSTEQVIRDLPEFTDRGSSVNVCDLLIEVTFTATNIPDTL